MTVAGEKRMTNDEKLDEVRHLLAMGEHIAHISTALGWSVTAIERAARLRKATDVLDVTYAYLGQLRRKS